MPLLCPTNVRLASTKADKEDSEALRKIEGRIIRPNVLAVLGTPILLLFQNRDFCYFENRAFCGESVITVNNDKKA